jgi:Fe-S cluster assembly iron-binding protein IscA
MAITLTENAGKNSGSAGEERQRTGAARRHQKSRLTWLCIHIRYADEVRRRSVFESHHAMLVVDTVSLLRFDGSHVDFYQRGISPIRPPDNPNAEE